MGKHKNKPKVGSKAYEVLKYIIQSNDHLASFEFKSISALAKYISKVTPYKIDRKFLSRAFLKFNAGEYSIGGVTNKDYIMCIPKQDKMLRDFGIEQPTKLVDDYYIEVNDTEGGDSEHVKGGCEDSSGMTFKELCEAEGIDPSEASGGWVKTKSLSVRMKTEGVDSTKDLDELLENAKNKLTDEFWEVGKTKITDGSGVGVAHLSDLHIGAYVQGLAKTPDFNLEILKEHLVNASDHINNFSFKEVHVKIYGDLIESFSGTNHPNTWKELENGIYGVEAVKIASKVIKEFFLDRVNNLKKISVVGGNHDRVTSNNQEDSKAGVANLVAYTWTLSGFDVQFDPLVISEEVDGIQYIMLHGDKGMSKRPTSDIILHHGKQQKIESCGKIRNLFNFVIEGHLHSRIQRLTAKAIDKFQLISDDSMDFRRQVLPSIFTGNSYSDDNAWYSNSGIVVTFNNGKGVPVTVDIPL